jgi:tripartite-type tricarboxylate transporter receptor subunit TctC
MKLPRRGFLHLAAGAAVLPAVSGIAAAQTYPTRPVRLIVAYAPGGQTDVIARLIAQKLSERLGKQFYVENVPGAGGNIGMGRAAQAAPDGYMALVADGTAYVVNPSLYSKVPYDPKRDFDPVTVAVTTTQVLAVHPSLPAQTVRDLVALVKANAGTYSYASSGIGTPSHLTGELFRVSLGLDLVHVPFNGGGPAIGSTVAGHTPIAFVSPAAAVPHIKDGNARLGGGVQSAIAGASGRADHGRGRLCGHRVPCLARSPRPGWDAAGDRDAAQSRDRRYRRPAGHARAPGRARLRGGGRYPGRPCRPNPD